MGTSDRKPNLETWRTDPDRGAKQFDFTGSLLMLSSNQSGMNRLLVLLPALCLMALSCSSPKLQPSHPEDYAELSKKWQPEGSASIAGYAYAKTAGDIRHFLFKGIVHLDPVTPYSTKVFEGIWQNNKFKTSYENETVRIDPVMLRFRKNAPINDQGAFKFNHVQPGNYYLSCYASWVVFRNDYVPDRYSID